MKKVVTAIKLIDSLHKASCCEDANKDLKDRLQKVGGYVGEVKYSMISITQAIEKVSCICELTQEEKDFIIQFRKLNWEEALKWAKNFKE